MLTACQVVSELAFSFALPFTPLYIQQLGVEDVTEAGLWAILEIWSDFREAFTAQDVKLLERVVAALARKTPAA